MHLRCCGSALFVRDLEVCSVCWISDRAESRPGMSRGWRREVCDRRVVACVFASDVESGGVVLDLCLCVCLWIWVWLCEAVGWERRVVRMVWRCWRVWVDVCGGERMNTDGVGDGGWFVVVSVLLFVGLVVRRCVAIISRGMDGVVLWL